MAKDAGASTSAAIPEQPAAVLSDADRESLRLLAQHVARAFYDPRLVVVVDQLTRHTVYALAFAHASFLEALILVNW